MPPLPIARPSLFGAGRGADAMAQSGHASRTRFVASWAFARAAVQRSSGSRAQIFSAARRIEASALHAVAQSDVERAACSAARFFSSVVRSSFGATSCARAYGDKVSQAASAAIAEGRIRDGEYRNFFAPPTSWDEKRFEASPLDRREKPEKPAKP